MPTNTPLAAHLDEHLRTLASLEARLGKQKKTSQLFKAAPFLSEPEEKLAASYKQLKAAQRGWNIVILLFFVMVIAFCPVLLGWVDNADAESFAQRYRALFAATALIGTLGSGVMVYVSQYKCNGINFLLDQMQPLVEAGDSCEKLYNLMQENPSVSKFVQGVTAHRALRVFDARVAFELGALLNTQSEKERQKRFCTAIHTGFAGSAGEVLGS